MGWLRFFRCCRRRPRMPRVWRSAAATVRSPAQAQQAARCDEGRSGAWLAGRRTAGGGPVESAPPNYYDHSSRAEDLASLDHDPQRWREDFQRAGDGKKNPDMFVIRKMRKVIWLQTEKWISNNLRQLPPVITYIWPEEGAGTMVSEFAPEVEVVEQDILEHAQELARSHRVAVLNMASAAQPGGGFREGAGAQEENLHRRSDLVRFLDTRWYPLPEDKCLVSKDVTVFRGSEKEGYPFLEEKFYVDFLTCAAVRYPHVHVDHCGCRYKYPDDEESMRKKARAILGAATAAHCDAVVLSAFGCGAFGNPPEEVARVFQEELRTACLKKVSFCIFNDHNSGRRHNPRGNFIPFKEAFARRERSMDL
ncbi:unnamed protein product [Effrenium voratum]|uniref:Microbial-type PARG catalytic domain-containing protein n=1 Tax=Effrenium voratum TaxID=2562239 RepID=A0AA36JBG1_9DINO|nr:unnamed protein product [Effrenium voratum]CAJ1418092.1 unnamed protein product [Effrenium voratum]